MPLLQKTFIKSLLDLHPFFFTLVKVSQASGAASLSSSATLANGAPGHALSPEAALGASASTSVEDVSLFMDSIVELDFLEEPSDD